MLRTKLSPFFKRQYFQIFSFPKLYKSLADIKQNFTGQDALFQYLIALLFGLILPLLAFLSINATVIFLAISAFFITLRFSVRPTYRPNLIVFLKSPTSIVLLAFISIVSVQSGHSLLQGELPHNTVINALKPSIILLFFYVCLGYFSYNKEEPFNHAISSFFLISVSAVMFFLSLDVFKNYIIWIVNGSDFLNPYGLNDWLTDILLQNKGIEFFATLIFLVPLHQRKLGLSSSVIYPLTFLLLIISFINIGNYSQLSYHIKHIDAETTQIGLIIALLAFVLTTHFPRLMTHLFFAITTSLLLCAPWVFNFLSLLLEKINLFLGTSLKIRLEIWHYVSDKIITGSFFGAGVNAGQNTELLSVYHPYYHKIIQHPHPHNLYLEIWHDLGIVGVLLTAILLLMAWHYTLNIKEISRPSVIATLTIIAILAIASRSLWESWRLALTAFTFLHLTLIQTEKKDKLNNKTQ